MRTGTIGVADVHAPGTASNVVLNVIGHGIG